MASGECSSDDISESSVFVLRVIQFCVRGQYGISKVLRCKKYSAKIVIVREGHKLLQGIQAEF
jgi:hypothetical protein